MYNPSCVKVIISSLIVTDFTETVRADVGLFNGFSTDTRSCKNEKNLLLKVVAMHSRIFIP